MRDDIEVIIKHDLKAKGITYGLLSEEITKLEDLCGKITDQSLKDYLRQFLPKWPKHAISRRLVAPDLLDFDSVIEDMQDFLPSCYLAPLGYLPVHPLPNGDRYLVHGQSGTVILGNHEVVDSDDKAKEWLGSSRAFAFNSIADLWKSLADGYRRMDQSRA